MAHQANGTSSPYLCWKIVIPYGHKTAYDIEMEIEEKYGDYDLIYSICEESNEVIVLTNLFIEIHVDFNDKDYESEYVG